MERDPNPLFAFFAAQLRRLREGKGWSQEALGKRIGYSGEMVSKVETGANRPARSLPPRVTRRSLRWAGCSPGWWKRRKVAQRLPGVV